MASATLAKIYAHLQEHKFIQLKTNTKQEHHLLRVAMVKRHSKHRKTLEDIGVTDEDALLSVSATFDPDTGVSKVYLRARNRREKEFTVIVGHVSDSEEEQEKAA